jgi:predicted metal-dependent peptidase
MSDRKKIEDAALQNIAVARALGKIDHPYMETELDSLAFVFVHGIGSRFACDAKRRIFCDPAYVSSIPPEQLLADMNHEIVVHLMGDHFIRADEFPIPLEDRQLSNVAGDASGNNTLFEMASTSNGRIRPDNVRIDPQNLAEAKRNTTWVTAENQNLPPNGTFEEYYVILKQRQEEQEQEEEGGGGGGGGEGEQNDDPDGEQGSGDSEPKESKNPMSGDGRGPVTKGSKPPPQGGKPQAGNQPPQFQPPKHKECGGCSGDTKTTDELEKMAEQQGTKVPEGRSLIEHKSIQQQTAMAIKQHVEGRGNAPAGLKRWAEDKLKPPKVDWRKHLRSMVAKGIGKARGQQDFTTSKLRKRSGLLLPTMYAPQPIVAMVLDTSGSMTDNDLNTSLSEVRGVFNVLQQGGASVVHITACDAQATKPEKLTRWNQQKVQSLLVGGGGTDMGAGIEAAATVKPTLTVVCTDGDTYWPAEKPKDAGKVIIALTRPGSFPTPKWATVVKAYSE